MNVKEAYTPYRVTANATLAIQGPSMGGFLCTVAGSVTVRDSSNTILVDALPVTAGVYYPIPLRFGGAGDGSLACSGGAAGTAFV